MGSELAIEGDGDTHLGSLRAVADAAPRSGLVHVRSRQEVPVEVSITIPAASTCGNGVLAALILIDDAGGRHPVGTLAVASLAGSAAVAA